MVSVLVGWEAVWLVVRLVGSESWLVGAGLVGVLGCGAGFVCLWVGVNRKFGLGSVERVGLVVARLLLPVVLLQRLYPFVPLCAFRLN